MLFSHLSEPFILPHAQLHNLSRSKILHIITSLFPTGNLPSPAHNLYFFPLSTFLLFHLVYLSFLNISYLFCRFSLFSSSPFFFLSSLPFLCTTTLSPFTSGSNPSFSIHQYSSSSSSSISSSVLPFYLVMYTLFIPLNVLSCFTTTCFPIPSCHFPRLSSFILFVYFIIDLGPYFYWFQYILWFRVCLTLFSIACYM